MKKIRLDSELKKKIAEEFKTSLQTVRMSLEYVFNSKKAKEIRKKALQLLREEIKNAIELEPEIEN